MGSFTLSAFLFLAVVSSMTLVCQGAAIEFCQGSCPEGWFNYEDRCFHHVAEKKTWLDAELNCLHLGGNLVSEHNEDEHEFLKHLHKTLDDKNGPFWIGLSDAHKEKTWLWSDGTRASGKDYTRWNPAEPNNFGGKEDCVHSNYGGKKNWNDVNCKRKYPSICSLRSNN
ncbi:hypothetical protein ANANG_G00172900 [Anguilla anguilla]|uniref:C-type lectin domain-containing protein n=1 Tax=Anguilla anguilla TaxID=7936 RepID=A0A9D3M5H7_ANGAN|nr:hypothetical protein ANANG_G00172900 [Anguilla anguilla]